MNIYASKYIIHYGKHQSGLGQPDIPGEKMCFKRMCGVQREEKQRGSVSSVF